MSPRFSQVRRDSVEYSFWLIFSEDGGLRLVRGEPSLGRGERAMSCNATLPRSLWRTPTLKATIDISDQAPGSFNIDIAAAGEALRQAMGVDVDLRINPPDEQP